MEDKNLDYYFAIMKQSKEVVSLNDVRKLIRLQQSTVRYNFMDHLRWWFTSPYLYPVVVTTCIALIITVTSLYYSTPNKSTIQTELHDITPYSENTRRWATLVNNYIEPSSSIPSIQIKKYSEANVDRSPIPLHLRVMIEPSDELLVKLGIRKEKGSLIYEANIEKKGYLKFEMSHSQSIHVSDFPAEGIKTYNFYPIFITDGDGIESIKYAFDTEQPDKMNDGYFEKVMNDLIPVVVNVSGEHSKKIIFWFNPSHDFLELLEPATHVPDKILLAEPTAWDVAIYPNPTHGQITLKLTLQLENTISIDLLGASGITVKSLSENTNTLPGLHHFNFDISAISDGIYFIHIRSSTGFSTIHRVFKY